jgi:hypothetical protein
MALSKRLPEPLAFEGLGVVLQDYVISTCCQFPISKRHDFAF